MKRIVKEEMVKKTTEVFVSIDGKEFTDEQKCNEWEKEMECTVNACWNAIPKGRMSVDEMCFDACGDDYLYIITPRNLEDIKIINMYTKLTETYALTQDDIGKEIILEQCCECDWYRIDSFDSIRKTFEDGVAQMKRDVDGYGLYECTLFYDGISMTEKGYSYDNCKNSVLHKFKRGKKSETLNWKEVRIIFTKDGEPFEDCNYVIEYTTETNRYVFELHKIQ